MKKVGLWVEHSIQLYSAKPVFDKYQSDGAIVYLITSINDIDICKSYLNIDEDRIISIKHIANKYHSLFTLIFEVVFVPEDFSMVYQYKVLQNETKRLKFLRKLFFFKLNKQSVNKYFIKYKSLIEFFGFKSKFPIELDLLVSFTKVYHTFSLPKKVPHISIMESWDHPIKLPYFVNPDYSLTWNKDLKNDTKYYQNIYRIGQIKPLKFRYIFDRLLLKREKIESSIDNSIYLKELNSLKNKRIILYPTTTSSLGIGHEGEKRLINDLCNIVENTDYYLYIKPKPNGPSGEYDGFKKYKNTIVGLYSTNSDSRDMLDENYHSFRYLLLDLSELVINAGTTFVLEAALLDKKILQLKLEGESFGKFTKYSNNHHLTKYILNNQFVFKYYGDLNLLSEAIKKSDYGFKNFIKPWITSW